MNWSIVQKGEMKLQPYRWNASYFSEFLGKQLKINVSLPKREPSEAKVFSNGIKIVPVEYIKPELTETETLNDVIYTVNEYSVTAEYTKRDKTEEELNPTPNPEILKRMKLENKYLEATKSLCQLAGDTINDGEWIKLEDEDFEEKALISSQNDPATTSVLLSTLNYTFFQLKNIGCRWEDIEYHPEVV